jgi:hypothetical protein
MEKPNIKARKCNRCESVVCKSEVEGYVYSCNSCDEDLYEFETHEEINETKRLSLDVWENIMRNTAENNEEVEVCWLDNVGRHGEYGLACGDELFEDGFYSEKEAQMRLDEIQDLLYPRLNKLDFNL